jgi:hypothetical protein
LRTRKRSKATAKPQSTHTAADDTSASKTISGLYGEQMAGMSELDDAQVKRPRAELP